MSIRGNYFYKGVENEKRLIIHGEYIEKVCGSYFVHFITSNIIVVKLFYLLFQHICSCILQYKKHFKYLYTCFVKWEVHSKNGI